MSFETLLALGTDYNVAEVQVYVKCYVLSLSARLNIDRGDRDIFDNPNCDSPTGGGCRNCSALKATCLNYNCKSCKCSETHRTFLPSDATNGQCVKNRDLLFIDPDGKFIDQ